MPGRPITRSGGWRQTIPNNNNTWYGLLDAVGRAHTPFASLNGFRNSLVGDEPWPSRDWDGDWDGGLGPQPHTPPHVPSAQCPVAQCTMHSCTPHQSDHLTSPPSPTPASAAQKGPRLLCQSVPSRVIRFRFLFQLPPPNPKFLRVHIDHDYPVGTAPRDAPLQMTTSTWAQLTFALRKIIHLHCTYMYLLHVYCQTLSVHSTTYSLVLHLSR